MRNIQPDISPSPPQPIILFLPAPPHLSSTSFSEPVSTKQSEKPDVPIHYSEFHSNLNSMQHDSSPDIPMLAPPFEEPAPIVPYKPINNHNHFGFKQPNQGTVPIYQPVPSTSSPLKLSASFEEAFSPSYIAPNDDSHETLLFPSVMFEKEYVSFPTMEGDFGQTVKFYL